MAKFLSETGLQTVWSKIDSLFLRKTSVDSVPTANSTNPISSGGMYSVLEEIEDTVAASENALNTRVTTLEENAVTGSGLTADKLVLGNGGKTVKTSTYGVTTTIPSSSSDNTTVPTSKAVWDAFGSVASALKYKGTVASNSALPATHSVGDVYVVSTAGTFAGKACEVGDYIVCKTAGTSANDGHWDVLNGENQVSNASASLAAAGSSATIATVDGTNITVTTPSTWTGVAKTGTVTSVTLTSGTGVTVSDSGTAITGSGSRTISLASVSGLTTGTYKSVTVDTYGRVTAGTNPTTLSGYGITDAKIASGVITLGSNTITPLTAASTLDATKLSGTIPAACYTHNHDSVYVKLNPGAAEQTIQSGIGTADKGVINLYRSNGNYVSYLGFSNKQNNTQTMLGQIGFTAAGVLSYKTADNTTYSILHGGNYNTSSFADTTPTENSTKLITSGGIYSALDEIESVVAASEDALNTRVTTLENNTVTGSGLTANTIILGNGTRTIKTSSKTISTTAPSSSSDDTTIPTSKAVNSAITSHSGVDKTGTVTSVTLTSGTGITVSNSGTAITTSGSRTISLASGVATAGTYRSVTVDTYGRVTSGTNPTTLSGYGITDAKIASGVITLGSNTITPLTSSSTLDATKLSGTIPSSCYTDTNTDIRLADYFGSCGTTASTVAKTTGNDSKTVAAGDLVDGFCAIIYHSTATSASNPTLNVGGSGGKAIYYLNSGTPARITGTTGRWAQYDIVRWVYDSSLNSGSGGWIKNAVLSNGTGSRLRVLTDRSPLYSYTETYQGTVTSVATGAGLTGGTITGSGTIKANLNSETSLGTIGTTDKLYAVGVDANGKLCVNVPWSGGTTVTVDNKAATIGTSLTTIATVGGTNITAKIGSYASSSHSHAFSAITSKPTTVSGYGITDAVTNIKHDIRIGANASSTRKLKDSSWTDVSYSPSSGVSTINAIPMYREDAQWGDWVFFWKGVDDNHNSNNTKGGLLWKNGEFVFHGITHFASTMAFNQSGTQTIGELSGGVIGASFYANNNGGGDTNSSAFFINVMTAAGGWNTHQTFRFDKSGIYTYPQSGRTGITGWFINEADALTTSEIDTILANAT